MPGLRHKGQWNNQLGPVSMRNSGYVLVEVTIVILIVAILFSISVPEFMNARENSWQTSCFRNQGLLDDAKAEWILEGGVGPSTVPNMTDLVPKYIKQTPTCPSNGVYTLGVEGTPVTCPIHPRETAGGGNGNNGGGNGNGNSGKGNGNGGN